MGPEVAEAVPCCSSSEVVPGVVEETGVIGYAMASEIGGAADGRMHTVPEAKMRMSSGQQYDPTGVKDGTVGVGGNGT